MDEDKSRHRWRLVLAISAAAFLGSNGAVAAGPDYEAAWQYCKKNALNQVKALATAKFDNISLKPVESVGIAVSFSMDAQSSSGAMPRMWITCAYDPSDPNSSPMFIGMSQEFEDHVREDAANTALQHRPAE